jgi:2-amino-4-hydroxy-6-hydroxymethyldihydropteridine diphosphokinase
LKHPIQAFIGLGSNLGDREAYLEAARRMLAEHAGVDLSKASSLYETEPVGYADQGWFLNQVVEVATWLDPYALLRVMQGIEQEIGRQRIIRWGPRVIDLDLLLYGDAVISGPKYTMRWSWLTVPKLICGPELTVPHPRLHERSFVLVPLAEIAPDHVHPDGRTTLRYLQALGAGQKIRLFRPSYGESPAREAWAFLPGGFPFHREPPC